MRRLCPAFLLLALVVNAAGADNLRGPVTAILRTGSANDSVRFGAGDLIVIESGSVGPMAAAMKVDLGIPDNLRHYRGTYALYLYKKVSPPPSIERKNYVAEAVEFLLLPPSSRLTLHLPLSTGYMIEESFDVSVIDTVFREDDFPLVLAVMQVMKGIPSEIAESVFDVSVSFVPSSLGGLRLELVFPDTGELPYAVKVDGAAARRTGNEFILQEGLHTLEITSPNYSNETVTFSVEAGAYTDLRVELQARSSRFIAEVPEGTRVFLDGALIETQNAKGMEIEPGDHSVVFKIGDYALSKSFSVLPGTTCTLSLDMEIDVKID
ncbi:MAG: hypothetical protein JW852_07320 [Spirochaetales bacterium]|nr:hypothetical protein [Spirochaetales bacterium]